MTSWTAKKTLKNLPQLTPPPQLPPTHCNTDSGDTAWPHLGDGDAGDRPRVQEDIAVGGRNGHVLHHSLRYGWHVQPGLGGKTQTPLPLPSLLHSCRVMTRSTEETTKRGPHSSLCVEASNGLSGCDVPQIPGWFIDHISRLLLYNTKPPNHRRMSQNCNWGEHRDAPYYILSLQQILFSRSVKSHWHHHKTVT